MAGSLKYYYAEWKKICSNKYILKAVKGFELPLMEEPQQISEPCPPNINQTEQEVVDNALSKLIDSGAVVKAKEEPGQFISNVFTVPKPDGSSRFIINLKSLNQFVESPHFKMEDSRVACMLISPGYYMSVLDLKDAYNLIPIAKHHRKYLRFRWKGCLYEYTCLPFGLNVAPRLFTKLMRVVFSHLRSQGHTSVYYLDDSLLIGRTSLECQQNVLVTCILFAKLGLVVNEIKSVKTPTEVIKFLGFLFDSRSMTVSLPNPKRHRVHVKCQEAVAGFRDDN